MLTLNLIAISGYYVVLAVEGAVALLAIILIISMLVKMSRRRKQQTEPAATTTLPEAVAEPVERPAEIIREINTVYVPTEVPQETVPKTTQVQEDGKSQPIIINVYNGGEAKKEEVKEEPKEPKQEVVVVEAEQEGGVKFSESKTILELYEELTVEQKSFFDELKNSALAKPNAVLSITKNYENVKIGKRSVIKLLIRRGVTVAEFLLENDLLKEYRKNSENKLGKSKIRIRPTVIAVNDIATFKTAMDMINIAYEQIIED